MEKTFLADAFPRQERSVRSSDDACGHLVDQVAAFLSEAPKAFHREGGEFIAALVEGHLSRSSVVAALERLRFGSSQPVSVSAACTHVAHRLWVCVRDAEQYRFVAILRRRSISEALSLDYDVHPVPFGVERRSAFTWWRIDIR